MSRSGGFLFFLVASKVIAGCSAGTEETQEASEEVVADKTVLQSVALTQYTLVGEAQTSGQHTGDYSTICNPSGLSGCYHKEFLCSGYGVPMQGTGHALNNNYVHWLGGGGGWNQNHTWLNNCASATFGVVAAPAGSSGRTLVADYSVAVDKSVITLGWWIWIDAQGHWYRADDTGGLITGNHLDIWEADTGNTPRANASNIFVTSTAHASGDVTPYVPTNLAPTNFAFLSKPVTLKWQVGTPNNTTYYNVDFWWWNGSAWTYSTTLRTSNSTTAITVTCNGCPVSDWAWHVQACNNNGCGPSWSNAAYVVY